MLLTNKQKEQLTEILGMAILWTLMLCVMTYFQASNLQKWSFVASSTAFTLIRMIAGIRRNNS